MTEKNESKDIESGRPAWAAGLDLSAERKRPTDALLAGRVRDFPDMQGILRRLADAEMQEAALNAAVVGLATEIAILRRQLRAERGEPDYLIDSTEQVWFHVRGDIYRSGFAEENLAGIQRRNPGPVIEAWK